VIARIHQVNHEPRFLYRVEKAVLFGPYVTGKQDRLKGLDGAIQLAPKEQDPARREQRIHERAAEAERAGKNFKSYADRMRYGETEVRDFLKSRSRAIVLRDLEEWIIREPHRVVFPA
jgi:hypothetical protein